MSRTTRTIESSRSGVRSLTPGARVPAARGTRSALSPSSSGRFGRGGGITAFDTNRFDRGRDGGRTNDGRRFGREGSRRGEHRDGFTYGGRHGSRGRHYSGYASPYGRGLYDYRPDFRNRYGFDYYGHLGGRYYSPAYRYLHYGSYQRCYGLGDYYYRPFYYPYSYSSYPSVVVYDRQPAYQEVGVVYTDPVVPETYTTPSYRHTTPSYVDPGTSGMGTMQRVVPGTDQVMEQDGQASGLIETPDDTGEVSTQEAAPAPALVEKGNEALREGRYEEARGWHARAMLADEGDGFAKLFYAMSNLGLKDYGAAASAIRQALKDAPELIDYPIDLRTVYGDASVLTGQIAELGRTVEAAGSADPDLTLLVGYLHYATGDPRRAVETLQDLATGDSSDSLARLIRDAATRVLPTPQDAAPRDTAGSDQT